MKQKLESLDEDDSATLCESTVSFFKLLIICYNAM